MTPLAVGSSAWRATHWGAGCDPRALVPAAWILGARNIQCHRDAVRAFRAVGRIMRTHQYVVRSDVTGAYNCRKLTGSATVISAHAQGIALDVNWDTNPYRTDKLVTDMPVAMREAIEALRTDQGELAVRGGWDWDGRPETPHSNYDAMHIEIIATPAQLKAGFSIEAFNRDDRWAWPLLARGEHGHAIAQLQVLVDRALGRNLEADGFFGMFTEEAVRAYQTSRGLVSDGVVGLGTWTALFSSQPALDSGDIQPHKGQAVAA